LFIIGMTTRRRSFTRATGGSAIGADDDRGQLARGETVRVKLQQLRARQPFDDVDRSLRAAAVRMAGRIQQRHQRFRGAHGRAVFVLPDRGDDLALARRDLGFGERWRHHDVAEEREHRLEVFREAGTAQREQVTADGDGQRDAAAVEVLGNLVRGPRAGAAIDHARQQPGRASGSRRIADRSRAHRQVDRHGWRGARLLRQEHGPVVERRAHWRKSGVNHGSHERMGSGSNQPTVRLDSDSTIRAAAATWSWVTARMLAGALVITSTFAIVSK
jgi:hypothetical protein